MLILIKNLQNLLKSLTIIYKIVFDLKFLQKSFDVNLILPSFRPSNQ